MRFYSSDKTLIIVAVSFTKIAQGLIHNHSLIDLLVRLRVEKLPRIKEYTTAAISMSFHTKGILSKSVRSGTTLQGAEWQLNKIREERLTRRKG